MPYQVTIYTEAERAAYRQRIAERGVPVSDLAVYTPASVKERTSWSHALFGVGDPTREEKTEACLRLKFAKPRSNLATRSEWIKLLHDAVLTCKREDGEGRGLSREEFLGLIGQSFERAEQSIKKGEEMGVTRAEQLKERICQSTMSRGPHRQIRVVFGSRGQMTGGLFHKELIELRKALGW